MLHKTRKKKIPKILLNVNSIFSIIQYYMASINEAACLADRICHGNPKNYPENCNNLTRFDQSRRPGVSEVAMGYWWTESNATGGSYTVEVGSTDPYCK